MVFARMLSVGILFLFAASLQAAQPAPTKVQKAPKVGKNETILYFSDLHCKTCAKKIARKLYAVKSVVKVRSNVKGNYAIATPQAKKSLDPKALWTAAQGAGFQPKKLAGPGGTFVPHPKTKAAQRVVAKPPLGKKTR